MSIASFDEIQKADDTAYVDVEAYGTTVRLGSLNSIDMIEWAEAKDEGKGRMAAGMRLIVKSLVDADGGRVPEEKFEAMLASFQTKNALSNTKVINAALKLNGFGADEAKNASGEAASEGSATDSPLQLAT